MGERLYSIREHTAHAASWTSSLRIFNILTWLRKRRCTERSQYSLSCSLRLAVKSKRSGSLNMFQLQILTQSLLLFPQGGDGGGDDGGNDVSRNNKTYKITSLQLQITNSASLDASHYLSL
jgi:hypothetical protein